MKLSARKRLVIVIVGVIAVALVARYAWKATRPRTGEIEGARLVRLDVAARTAQIEFLRRGRPVTLSGKVPAECAITIDGEEARLEDLRVGDVADVRGMVYPDRSVRPEWVRVKRATTTTAAGRGTTQPTSATAPSQPTH